MRTRLSCLAALLLVAATFTLAGEGAQKAHVVKGLTLTEPMTRSRPGVAKIVATVAVADKDKDKVKMVWDVEAQFEDPDVEFDWEVRDGGMAVQVVIPDSRGVIRVSAVAVVNGEPTDARMAKTLITVDYRPRQQPQQPPPDKDKDKEPPPDEDKDKSVLPKQQQTKKERAAPKQPAKEVVKGKIDRVIFVIDPIDGDENVSALVQAQRTKNELKKIDVKPELATFTTETQAAVLSKLNLTEPVRKAGGAPVAVWIVSDRIRKVTRLTPQTKLDDLIKEASGE